MTTQSFRIITVERRGTRQRSRLTFRAGLEDMLAEVERETDRLRSREDTITVALDKDFIPIVEVRDV